MNGGLFPLRKEKGYMVYLAYRADAPDGKKYMLIRETVEELIDRDVARAEIRALVARTLLPQGKS